MKSLQIKSSAEVIESVQRIPLPFKCKEQFTDKEGHPGYSILTYDDDKDVAEEVGGGGEYLMAVLELMGHCSNFKAVKSPEKIQRVPTARGGRAGRTPPLHPRSS